MANTLETLATLSAAEEFFEHLGVAYDPAVIHVNRLHILKRFNQYLRTSRARCRRPGSGRAAAYVQRITDPSLPRLRTLDSRAGESLQGLS